MTAENTAQIQVAVAYDMRDPAQRRALGQALALSPLERAEAELLAARARVRHFVDGLTLAQGMAFAERRTVPADLAPARAARLADLLTVERAAVAKVRAFSVAARSEAA